MTQAISNDPTLNAMDRPSRLQIRLETGSWLPNDVPKSPCTKPVIHFLYWTYHGSSTPYCFFSASICVWETSPPTVRSRWISWVSADPGAALMIAKLATEMTMRVRIM